MLHVKSLITSFVVANLFFSAAIAQSGNAEFNWHDSSKISRGRMSQFQQFQNHQYPYPAKPRSMWELGFAAGNAMILGDIRPHADLGGAVTLRKALSHTFSIRVGYFGARSEGYPSGEQRIELATNPFYRFYNVNGNTAKDFAYQNWRHSGVIDLIASLNPRSPYRGNPKTNYYVLGGVDLIATRVFYKAPNSPNARHIQNDYRVFYGTGFTATKAGIITTFGPTKQNANGRKGWTLLGGASAGAGFALKLSKRINLALEQRFTFVQYDYLDAVKGGNENDIYSFSSGRINFNIGSSAHQVEPLWWLNPNNYVYNELNRPTHFDIPPPVLPDADNDGVTDQFDKEPSTPSGAPVDTHGVAKDTDGDGVPDYKDQELLTPQSCMPADANGVGLCPEPACCKQIRDSINSGIVVGNNCNIGNLPSVRFQSTSTTLTKEAMALLASAASQLKANENCNVKLVGYGFPDKRLQRLSWERVSAVRKYLFERQGISESRIIFTYAQKGDENSVDLIPTIEMGSTTVPSAPPYPRLTPKKRTKAKK